MKGYSGGLLGLAAVVGVIALITAGRSLFPMLSAVLLIGGGAFLALILAIFILALTVGRDSTSKKPAESAYGDVLAAARSDLLQLRRATVRVRRREIAWEAGEIQDQAEKILRIMKDRPNAIPAARRFWNYYLPTTRKILEKYAYLEENGQIREETTENTLQCLTQIRTAMEQQREKLFAGDVLDLTAEMDVLKTMCQRDGILTEADFSAVEQQASPTEGESESASEKKSQKESQKESEEEFTDGYTDGYTDELEEGSGSARPG